LVIAVGLSFMLAACTPPADTDTLQNVTVSIGEGQDFDSAAIGNVLAGLVPADFSDQGFQVVVAVQNISGAETTFNAVVDGNATVARVADRQQTVVVIQDAACPTTVRLQDFVTQDGRTISPIEFTQGTATNLAPEEGANPTFACPAVIVVVISADQISLFTFERNL
jgi:hypothetical protein